MGLRDLSSCIICVPLPSGRPISESSTSKSSRSAAAQRFSDAGRFGHRATKALEKADHHASSIGMVLHEEYAAARKPGTSGAREGTAAIDSDCTVVELGFECRAPCRHPKLLALIVPPCISISDLEIESPRPQPAPACAILRSAQNALKKSLEHLRLDANPRCP